jgi:type VI secretion system protein VasD
MSSLAHDPEHGAPQRGRRRLLALAPLLLLAAAGVGCTSAPRRTVPITLALDILASHDANPDINDRPSPVVLSVYRLRKLEGFRSLDYFSLTEGQHGEFTLEESFPLQPGGRAERRYTLGPEDIGFGVVAGYRAIEHSQWRVSAELPPLRVSRIKLPEVLSRADPVMDYRLLVGRTALDLARGAHA